MKRSLKSKSHFVQACITTVSFPSTFDAVYKMVDKHQRYESDMESLISEDVVFEEIWWSAAKWVLQGDILFFYHTKSAHQRIKSLLKKIEEKDDPDLWGMLKHSERIAERYGGTIFGFGVIKKPSKNLGYEPDLYHFKGRIFAPVVDVHIFEKPLSAEKFNTFLSIGQSTITALDKKAFEGVQMLLLEENDVPDYLQEATFSEAGFYNITKDNWLDVIARENVSFLYEV